jgi:hypothetical protein
MVCSVMVWRFVDHWIICCNNKAIAERDKKNVFLIGCAKGY